MRLLGLVALIFLVVMSVSVFGMPTGLARGCADSGVRPGLLQGCCDGLVVVQGQCARPAHLVTCARNAPVKEFGSCCAGFEPNKDRLCVPRMPKKACSSVGQSGKNIKCCARLVMDDTGVCRVCAPDGIRAAAIRGRCCLGLVEIDGVCRRPTCVGKGLFVREKKCCPGLIVLGGKCSEHPVCALRGERASVFGECCGGFSQTPAGVCAPVQIECAREDEFISATKTCCAGLHVVKGACVKE